MSIPVTHPDDTTPIHVITMPTEFRARVAADNEAIAVRYAEQDARRRGHDDLLDRRSTLHYWTVFRQYDDDDSEAVQRELDRRELEAVEREVRRRQAALARATAPSCSTTRVGSGSLGEVVRQVKAIVTVPQALADLGFDPKRTGTSRGREEWKSPCPICGGVDRCISWGSPDSNWTCRQCRAGGDVVTLAEKVLRVDFAEATRRLARLAGVAA